MKRNINLRALALMAASGASIIYGANHTIAKGLMPDVIRPHAFILLRVTGAALLFWLIAQFFPKERLKKKDRLLFLWCALFGMSINMTSFFKGLELSTPINSSVVITLVPVILLVLGRIFLKERISALKATGIFIGLAGAIGLVLLDVQTQTFLLVTNQMLMNGM